VNELSDNELSCDDNVKQLNAMHLYKERGRGCFCAYRPNLVDIGDKNGVRETNE
jgi:hypothetical protein